MISLLRTSMPVRYFRLFWSWVGPKILVVAGLTVIMSYLEGLGIALFFPLFADGPAADPLSATLTRFLGFFHIPMTPRGVLPILAALFFGKGVLQFAVSTYQLLLQTRVTRWLRQRFVDALGRADYRYLSGTNAGFHTNLMVNEVNRATVGFLYFTRSIPPAINGLVFFTIVLILDWRLTLVCVAMGVTVVGLSGITGRIARRYSEITTTEASSLTALLIQMLHAFKYLRATSAFGGFQKRLYGSADRLAHAEARSSTASALTMSMSQPIMVLFLVALLYHRSVVRGEELAPLFVILAYFFRMMSELFVLQTAWQTFCGLLGSIDMVQKATEDVERSVEPRGTAPFTGLTQSLAAKDVTFSYQPDREILREVTLSIPHRATVAFVGESGSGKTTMVDLLTGTLKPTQGKIVVDGQDLAEIDIEAVRRRIGYVPQDSMVFDDTVANNISLWGDASEEKIRDAARRALCDDFIQAMPQGYASPIGDRGVKLSGGQRQRLAIARELLKDPDILVLDEATSALDSQSEQAIQRSIDSLRGQMTILIVAHRLSTIRNCDYIYVLHQGRIVEEGGYQELAGRAEGRFHRMVQLQQLEERHG